MPQISTNVIDAAKEANIVDLAGKYTKLERIAADEYAGPCPKCGGDDRFHAKKDGWFCRDCKPIDPVHGWHDAVDFVQWNHGLTFAKSVEYLTGAPLPDEMRRIQPREPVERRIEEQPETWRPHAESLVERATHRLFTDGRDARGADYLMSRGLEPWTWQQFGVGYATHYHPVSRQEEPAIVLPWLRAGKLTAVRFRFLNPPDGGPKIISLKGSKFAGYFYGGVGLLGAAEDKRTLVICEGEINALSIWQAQHEAALDVLSLGSESAKLTDTMIDYAKRFATVIIWMDKAEIARDLMSHLPNGFAYSNDEMDANDFHRDGRLGALLAAQRWNAAKTDHERQRLIYDLEDSMKVLGKEDAGTLRALAAMKKKMAA